MVLQLFLVEFAISALLEHIKLLSLGLQWRADDLRQFGLLRLLRAFSVLALRRPVAQDDLGRVVHLIQVGGGKTRVVVVTVAHAGTMRISLINQVV